MNCEKSLHRAVISHMLSGWCKNRTRNVGDQGLQEARWVGRILAYLRESTNFWRFVRKE
jgi:hypothetical protein